MRVKYYIAIENNNVFIYTVNSLTEQSCQT